MSWTGTGWTLTGVFLAINRLLTNGSAENMCYRGSVTFRRYFYIMWLFTCRLNGCWMLLRTILTSLDRESLGDWSRRADIDWMYMTKLTHIKYEKKKWVDFPVLPWPLGRNDIFAGRTFLTLTGRTCQRVLAASFIKIHTYKVTGPLPPLADALRTLGINYAYWCSPKTSTFSPPSGPHSCLHRQTGHRSHP